MSDRRRRFQRLWLLWAVGGITSAAIIEGIDLWSHLRDANHGSLPWVWIIWVVIGTLSGGGMELYALRHPEVGDTLSEQIWNIEEGGRSFIVMLCLVGAWVVFTHEFWPVFGIGFFIWAAYHFAFEGPDPSYDRDHSEEGP